MASINFERDWIVDSGCGHHLSRNKSKFYTFREYMGHNIIVTSDNTVHNVEKKGTVVINDKQTDTITLNIVFHVPGMKKNLFLVANAVDARNYLLFGPHDVKFLRNIKVIMAIITHSAQVRSFQQVCGVQRNS
uniref:Uncharacterized protein LOC104242758 n=1 Tax=Nicotiana sylvestris TaxID=4096 RepID=A0A1U7Y2G6_NICSY|nr:PREDICTED: uncharacterized protein LOC104242758 [Nicotiana sylvestris]